MPSAANKIDASDKTLRDILHSRKYSIDFFQREYKWERKHIEQLLIDVEEAFNSCYKLGDTIENVSEYDSYYMGPLIFCEKSGVSSIIDGQQRLTSITLLLIYLNNIQKNRDDAEPVEDLIYSRKHGRNTFNIEVPERFDILNAFYNDEEFDITDNKNLTIQNIYDRYQDINEIFPESLRDSKLPLFVDWLKEKLVFVEIVAYSDKNAFTIFETMNDRGYNLTPSEMLKGLLLSKVEKEEFLYDLNNIWREQISKLHYFSRDEDLEFFRAWFRGQYAETMKKSSAAGTAREDFEKIGTSFHRWVKENAKKLKLKSEENYYYFVKGDFVFYSDLYIKIKQLENHVNPGFEQINYITNYSIATSLSYPLYLSSISKTDSQEIINLKLKIIANFIDRYVVIKTVNHQAISQTSIRYSFFNNIIREIRDLDVNTLEKFLLDQLNQLEGSFENLKNIYTHNTNRKFMRYLFARISQHIEGFCGNEIDFYDLISARRRSGSNLVHLLNDSDKSKFPTEEEYFNAATNVASISLLRKDADELEPDEYNLIYRVLSHGNVSNEEKKILEKRYPLPKEKNVGFKWIDENLSFLIKVCEDIWMNNSLND